MLESRGERRKGVEPSYSATKHHHPSGRETERERKLEGLKLKFELLPLQKEFSSLSSSSDDDKRLLFTPRTPPPRGALRTFPRFFCCCFPCCCCFCNGRKGEKFDKSTFALGKRCKDLLRPEGGGGEEVRGKSEEAINSRFYHHARDVQFRVFLLLLLFSHSPEIAQGKKRKR